ncbi:MAG: leucine-rich repeat domain-containing protein [Clostridia bacterium]|nr:leucine-rich repeat domain-containing protein [Clostridia bacterium]
MKKKILLFSLLVAILVCAFAICVSAEDNIIKLDKLPTLDEIHANREAYVSYVEALEDETTYKAADPDSVIVLSDLAATPTYYVYPAYYLIRSTYYSIAANLSKFNDAILASDPTAFAGYKSDGGTWGKGECDYMIRLEMPKYVDKIHGQYKFEGSVNIKEIYFPIHTVIDEETGLEKTVPYCNSISGQNLFGGCSSLEVIHNQKYLPKELFQGNNAGFSGCSSLKGIYIPEGVTSLSGSFFKGCASLKEITLPNSLVSVGKAAFSGCTSLETFSFGAGFTTLERVNNDYETLNGCSSLKYVYMPVGFLTAIQGAKANDYKHIFNNLGSAKVTFFFTGTEAEATQIKELMASTNNNPNLGNAIIEKYNEKTDYTNYGVIKDSNVIVYGYNLCDAFYNGDHDEKAELEYRFSGEKYISAFCSYAGCTRCPVEVETEIVASLFTSKGYSKSDDAFMYDIQVNFAAIEAYKAFNKTMYNKDVVINYGLVVSGDTTITELLNSDATTVNNNVIKMEFGGAIYTKLQVKLNGISSDTAKALAVHACAYVIEDDTVSYIGEGVTKTTSTTICFNDIDGEEENVTPPENEEIPQE